MIRFDEDMHVVAHDFHCPHCGGLLTAEYYPPTTWPSHPHMIYRWECRNELCFTPAGQRYIFARKEDGTPAVVAEGEVVAA